MEQSQLDKIKGIRRKSKYMNIFLIGKKLNEFMEQKNVKVCTGEDIVVLKKETTECTRLYFFTDNIESVKLIDRYIDETDKKPIMIDIIGKIEEANELSNILAQSNFSNYITFGKWQGNSDTLVFRRKYTDEDIWDEPVRIATLDDLDAVYNLLDSNFDKLSYELQDKETLRKQIENKEVYVTGINGKVVAFFIALRPSENICMLDYSAVDLSVRGAGACMYIYGYVLQRLPENVKIIYYASVTNSVTGREKGLFGMKKENFSKIIMKYNK